MYVAAVLTEVSANTLKELIQSFKTVHGNISFDDLDGFVFQTALGQPLPHHMTVNLGSFDHHLNNQQIMDSDFVSLTFTEVWCNKNLGVCAVPIVAAFAQIGDTRVEVKTANSTPHVTCCIKPDSKPKFSNDMFEVGEAIIKVLPRPMVLVAHMQMCP